MNPIPKGKNGQIPGPLKPDGTWEWVDPPKSEVEWLDERIRVVRELARSAVNGTPEEMRVALSTILQQLSGVSRTTSAPPKP